MMSMIPCANLVTRCDADGACYINKCVFQCHEFVYKVLAHACHDAHGFREKGVQSNNNRSVLEMI